MKRTKSIGPLLFFVLLLINLSSFAAVIKGHVKDSHTGEILSEATIRIEGNGRIKTVIANLDGSYQFKNLKDGIYKLKIEAAGYEKRALEVRIKNETSILEINIEMEENTTELKDVKVTSGLSKLNDEGIRHMEKNSDVVENILSQKAIELSPDVTVANSLQRISGVSMQRTNNGESKYAIIRGMDQRYNTTLINGIKIPSPDDKYRYVPMNIFPSDLLERLEVTKSLTPSMEGDAIGGVMNLIMKNAPKHRIFNIFAATGTSTLFTDGRKFAKFNHQVISIKDPYELAGSSSSFKATESQFPRQNLDLDSIHAPLNIHAGLTYGDRFFHNKLGFIIGIGYQKDFQGSDEIFNAQYPGARVLPASVTGGSIVENYPQFNTATLRYYSTEQKKVAINNKWDYNFNERNKISLYNLYVRMDEFQSRYSIDTDVNTNIGNIAMTTRTRWQIQDLYNGTIQGNHQLSDKLTFDWTGAYSYARQRVPDYASFEVDNHAYSSDSLLYESGTGVLKSMTRIWTHNTDKDLSGYINLSYAIDNNTKIKVGGMYRHKNRDNFYHEYSLSPKNSGTQLYTTIEDASYDFKADGTGDDGSGDFGTGRNYTINENVSAGYIQASHKFSDKLEMLGGIRYEHTLQKYNTNLSTSLNAINGKIWFNDFLPSLHIHYKLTEKQNLRLSYFRSLLRPSYVDIIPAITPASENEAYAQQGNPYLKHTTADNLDFRYELYPTLSDQFFVGVFYKKIYDPIETVFSHYSVTGGNSSPGDNYLTPENVGTVRNYGTEIVLTHYFGMFGITANYTYTHSRTRTSKFYMAYDATTGRTVTDSVYQNRPLQGQAKNIANVSVLYKNPYIGLDAQLAFVYTGERISQVNSFYNMDTWQSPYSQVDFSFEKKITRHLSIYGKANNLTNSKTRYFIKMPYLIGNTLNRIPGQDDPSKSIFVQRSIYKTSFMAGLKFNL